MTVEINSSVFDEFKARAADRVFRVVTQFETVHKARIGIQNPRPYLDSSKPGEYLKKRTGQHNAGIVRSVVTAEDVIANGFIAKIGLLENAWYGIWHETDNGRLGFAKTAEDLRDSAAAMLATVNQK